MNKKYIEECRKCKISNEIKKELCPYCIAQKVINGKWKMLIFWHLKDKTMRFNELNRLIPATSSTLSRQLKELEIDGMVERKSYNEIPPRVEYYLTPMGKKFKDVMKSVKSWPNLYLIEENISL
jgi:DNA-binding HxlR family transcriptional regulator